MPDLLHIEAMAALARGWTLTPLDGKVPVLPGWQTTSTPPSDISIRRWLAEGRNLGLRTGTVSGGVYVVDLDAGADLQLTDLPATPTVRTGSGGWHLYYRSAQPLGNRCGTLRGRDGGKLANVDLRGDGGQVVYPGSIHPDTAEPYRWTIPPHVLPLAPLPDWLLVVPRRAPAGEGSSTPADVTMGQRESRCRRYLQHLPDAVSGSGGHNQTFQAAVECWRFGLDDAAWWRVMAWFNAAKCSPEWSERELDHKRQDALQKVASAGELGARLKEDRRAA
jgi:hypothetical protein